MGIIRDLIPTNLDSEKAKFYADDHYNPQFTYVREFTDEEMNKYDHPKKEYFEHAQKMLELYGLPLLSGEVESFPPDAPPYATQQDVENYLLDLVEKLGLPKLPARFAEEFGSQMMLVGGSLHVRLPIKFTTSNLRHKLNHEVQTHYLRRYNQDLQEWNFESEKKHPQAFRTTEEGLANLHSFVERPDPVMRKTYLNYFAAYLGHQASFRQLYNELIAVGVNERLAWNLTLKQKRGLKDTSLPGGWSKNHIYFEGTVKVWHWLADNSNDPRALYYGRITLEDVPRVLELPLSQEIIFPTFYQDLNSYRQLIDAIGKINKLTELPVFA